MSGILAIGVLMRKFYKYIQHRSVSTYVIIEERYLCPRRTSDTLIRESLAGTRLNGGTVMSVTGPRRGIETWVLIGHGSSPLSGAERWLMVVKRCSIGKGLGLNHLCRRTARGPVWRTE